MGVRLGLGDAVGRFAGMIGRAASRPHLAGGEIASGLGRIGACMLMMAEMARRPARLVLAIGADSPPAKLERHGNKQQVDETADHALQYTPVMPYHAVHERI